MSFNQSWKSPVAVLVVVLVLYFFSLRVDARRPAEDDPQAPAPAAAPSDSTPPSNEVELQQLG